MLTKMQEKFVIEYCRDLSEEGKRPNATEAAIRAGFAKNSAQEQSSVLLSKPMIQNAISERMRDIAAAAAVTPEFVLRQWLDIARADPNDLTQIRLINCRHCRGIGHAYQWTEGEYLKAVEMAIAAKMPAPDGSGGFGFDRTLSPVPDCPECSGLGREDMYIADTRNLKGPAKRLFAGVQRTNTGVKILMRDQDAALANLAKYLGMLVDRKELSGPNGGPVPIASIKAEDLTDDQLAAILNADQQTSGG